MIYQKKYCIISEVSESQPLFGKCPLRAARFQTLTFAPLKNTNLETKILLRKTSFLDENSQNTRLKTFHATPMSHGHSRDAESYYDTYTRGNFPGEGSRSKIVAKGKNNWKILLHIKSTPKSRREFLQAIQWMSRSPIYFYCLYDRLKSVGKSWQVLKKPMFWQLSAKTPGEKFARSQNWQQ